MIGRLSSSATAHGGAVWPAPRSRSLGLRNPPTFAEMGQQLSEARDKITKAHGSRSSRPCISDGLLGLNLLADACVIFSIHVAEPAQ